MLHHGILRYDGAGCTGVASSNDAVCDAFVDYKACRAHNCTATPVHRSLLHVSQTRGSPDSRNPLQLPKGDSERRLPHLTSSQQDNLSKTLSWEIGCMIWSLSFQAFLSKKKSYIVLYRLLTGVRMLLYALTRIHAECHCDPHPSTALVQTTLETGRLMMQAVSDGSEGYSVSTAYVTGFRL
jgi:hypothetical protein